jgi:hypothetical protein
MTTPHEPRRNPDVDYAIDDLLMFTKTGNVPVDEGLLDGFRKLPELRDQLRRRLEEDPDILGASSEASAQFLRIAYAACTHLNWVTIRKLTPGIIAAALPSDELQSASALSICVDDFQLDEDEEGINELVVAIAQSTSLKQLCILQRPDRDNTDAYARFCTKILSSSHSEWLRYKTIYSTCAFSAPLRGRSFPSQSTTNVNLTFPFARALSVIHMFTFDGHQHEGAADTTYSHHYNMGNTLLDPENFADRFLSYIRSAGSGSGSDKAILQFSRGVAPSLTSTTNTTTDNDNDNSPPPSPLSPSGRFAVGPIPAGFFGNSPTGNAQNKLRARRITLGDIHPGSWVVLIDQQGLNSSGDVVEDEDGDGYYDREEDDIVLRYAFIKIRQASADIAPEDHEQHQPPATPDLIPAHNPNPNLIDVIVGLTDFLHSTVPGLDTSTWEKRVSEAESDFLASARDLQNRRSYERAKDMDIRTWERRMIEAERRRAAGLPEIKRKELGVDLGVLHEGRARGLLRQLL